METLLKGKLIKRIALVFFLIVMFSACQQHDPVSSDYAADTQGTVHILQANAPSQLAKLFEVKSLIDDDGGVVVAGDSENGYSYLKFPEDAINENNYPDGVVVYFFWQSDGLLQADCYPEGMQFENPVKIHLSYKNANLIGVKESKLDLYYFNPENGQYESIGAVVNTAGKYVEGTINHFSRYAIGYE